MAPAVLRWVLLWQQWADSLSVLQIFCEERHQLLLIRHTKAALAAKRMHLLKRERKQKGRSLLCGQYGINVLLQKQFTCFAKQLALKPDGVQVEAGGIVRVEQLLDYHLVEGFEESCAFHNMGLCVHSSHILLINLTPDHLEVLVMIQILQYPIHDLI